MKSRQPAQRSGNERTQTPIWSKHEGYACLSVMELECAVEITNKYGLHARAAQRLSQLANRCQSTITISKLGEVEEADAKSILSLMSLGVPKGETVRIRVCGGDAEEAMAAVVDLVHHDFYE